MILRVAVKNIFSDFEWVIRVLESSKTNSHLDCVLNCFKLWESKYCGENLNLENKKIIKSLRLEFWALFKNKSSRCVKIN